MVRIKPTVMVKLRDLNRKGYFLQFGASIKVSEKIKNETFNFPGQC